MITELLGLALYHQEKAHTYTDAALLCDPQTARAFEEKSTVHEQWAALVRAAIERIKDADRRKDV